MFCAAPRPRVDWIGYISTVERSGFPEAVSDGPAVAALQTIKVGRSRAAYSVNRVKSCVSNRIEPRRVSLGSASAEQAQVEVE
jgi:hypothetical protein